MHPLTSPGSPPPAPRPTRSQLRRTLDQRSPPVPAGQSCRCWRVKSVRWRTGMASEPGEGGTGRGRVGHRHPLPLSRGKGCVGGNGAPTLCRAGLTHGCSQGRSERREARRDRTPAGLGGLAAGRGACPDAQPGAVVRLLGEASLPVPQPLAPTGFRAQPQAPISR